MKRKRHGAEQIIAKLRETAAMVTASCNVHM